MMNVLFSGLIAAVLTGFFTWVLNDRNHKRETKRLSEEYAAVWHSALTELFHALGRMESATRLYLESKKFQLYQIQLIDGLALSFLSRSKHPDESKLMYGMYNNILHFERCYRLGVEYRRVANTRAQEGQRSVGVVPPWSQIVGGAIWIGQNRHHMMKIDFEKCVAALDRFCIEQELSFRPKFPELELLDESQRLDETKASLQEQDGLESP